MPHRNLLPTFAAFLVTACATGTRPPTATFGRAAPASIAGAGANGPSGAAGTGLARGTSDPAPAAPAAVAAGANGPAGGNEAGGAAGANGPAGGNGAGGAAGAIGPAGGNGAGGAAGAIGPAGGNGARVSGAEGGGRAPLVLPPVDLLTLDGQVTQLQAVAGGRVTVVALWATWCKTCKGELPALARLSERAAAQGAAVLGIAVGETRDTVAAFVSRRGLRYPQLVDEEYRLSALIGSDRIPTTLILDRHARITYVGGPLDESALAALRTELQRPSAVQ
jgi:thiol-disulfide isomerase/thioredoxin